MSVPRKNLLITAFALCWLSALLAALWWYQNRYIRPFELRSELFSAAELALPAELAGPGPIRLVHFWDPACPCNVGNQQHLAELVAHYAALGVSFHAVQKPGTKGQLPELLSNIPVLALPPGAGQIPASPAVAIWDQQGRLAYFGPYSEGATCNASNSFIEPVLQALLDGRPVNATQTLASGCFCDWRPAN
ncbi:hypothetical protein SAMN05216296_3077 [Pseudomonas pohangensis]|uniref:DUF6436 domain-containing protein n=1 Tax=Pseudomonas pohangensis TaxID=364197 RepID=A0A1H2HKL4_9PSED|nr:DUF6436 domain-containing protein [Pseudomonas pohangensis]SDU32385.1 hypothetical protein SAMN05216296_3077 [Pseudomonas pohangensis]